MKLITRKKRINLVREGLRSYLHEYRRAATLPVRYGDLTRYGDTTPVYDKSGRDTLWETVLYPSADRREIARALVQTYAILKVHGDSSLMRHLVTDRVDVCSYGNTQPFRVRILNTLNDNFDYFYVKRADASRIYGLELEHVLAPNHIEFLVDDETVVEQHVIGIPGDVFVRDYLGTRHLDEVRLAKEFVKFNERCFLRLLGDMHVGNFVVDITPDFDETDYRLRAIDFDQQSYEGRRQVYLPQYYTENNPIIDIGMRVMTPETMRQYQHEERAFVRNRARADADRLRALLETMSGDQLAPEAHVHELRDDLAKHYADERFDACESMGALVAASLDRLGWRDE